MWTGQRLIVWGGERFAPSLREKVDTGAAYDPVTDSWEPLPPSPLQARVDASAVWTGDAMIIWGGGVGDSEDDEFWGDAADGAMFVP